MKNTICSFILNKFIISTLLLSFASALYAQENNKENEILVSNSDELNSAIKLAKPGSLIRMKDGIWNNVSINFNSNAKADAKIILKAQTPGKVILNGNSKLTFLSPHLMADGLVFKNGSIEGGSVVSFNSDSCRLTNSEIADYNPTKFETNYYWVYFKGNYNRLDHCLLSGKNNMSPVIGNDDENSRHNLVDYCHIKNIEYVSGANGREIMRIWGYGHADELGNDGAYFTVEFNLFEHADGEGTEIISLKSNYNMVRYNTIRASRGGIVNRRGKYNLIEGNFIFGENIEKTTGIRVAGFNNRIVNNYICDVAEDGIRLIAGEYINSSLTTGFKAEKKKPLPKYLPVQNCYFAHNTIINTGGFGIDIGFGYMKDWPEIQMVLLPENNQFVNNLVYRHKKKSINFAVQNFDAPLNIFTFKPNVFNGNIVFDGKNSMEKLPDGVIFKDPKLKFNKDGLYRLSNNSSMINAGVKSDVTLDMDGQIRSEKKDIGADQWSESAVILHPITDQEVGPEWKIKKKGKK